MTWTQSDEQRYQEQRRRTAIGKVRECFDRIDFRRGITDSAMEEVLRNADSIRDVLAPFDSGIRVQEVSA